MKKTFVFSLLIAVLTSIPVGAAAADKDPQGVYKQERTCDALVQTYAADDADQVADLESVEEFETTEDVEAYQAQIEQWFSASFCVKDDGNCQLRVSQCGDLETDEWSDGPFLDEVRAESRALELRLDCYRRPPERTATPVPLTSEWSGSMVPVAVGAVIDRLAEEALAQVDMLTAPPPATIQAGAELAKDGVPANLTPFLESAAASLAQNEADLGLLEKLREVADFDPQLGPWSTFSAAQLFDFRHRLHVAATELQELGVSRSSSQWAASSQILDGIESELARRGRGYRSSAVSAKDQQRRFEAVLQLNSVARREALHLIDGSMLVVDDREQVARLADTVRSIDLAAGVPESGLPAARDLVTTETGSFRISTLARGVEDLTAKANLLYGVCASCDVHLRVVRQALDLEIESFRSRQLSDAMRVTPTRGPPEASLDSFYTAMERQKMKADHDEARSVVRRRQRETMGLVVPGGPQTNDEEAPRPPPRPRSLGTSVDERMANLAESYFRSLAHDLAEGIVAEAELQATIEARRGDGHLTAPAPADFLATDPGRIDDLLRELRRSQRSVEVQLMRLGLGAPTDLHKRAQSLGEAIASLVEGRQQAEQREWKQSEVVQEWIESSATGPLDDEASLAKIRSIRRALERAAVDWGPLAPTSLAIRLEQAVDLETSYKIVSTTRGEPMMELAPSARELDALRSPEGLEVRQVVTAGRDFSSVDELGFARRRQPRLFGLQQESERRSILRSRENPGGIWLTPEGEELAATGAIHGYEVEDEEPCPPGHLRLSEPSVTRCLPSAKVTHTWMEELRPW